MSKGMGRIYKPVYTDRKGAKKEGANWHIQWGADGKVYRESTGTTLYEEAKEVLTNRLANRARAIPQPRLNRVRYEDLEKLIVDDYELHEKRSIGSLHGRLKHLRAYFGGWKVVSIDTTAITDYTKARKEAETAPATINRELSALRRMLKLATINSKARDVPHIELLPEKNIRKGKWTDAEMRRVLKASPDWLKPLIQVAFLTGWRRGECLSRRWRHVDFDDGFIRLEAHETKSGDPRNFPLYPELLAVLKRQDRRRRQVQRETGRVVTALFFYSDGRQVKDFRRAWLKALKDANCEHRIFHDFRRTAVTRFTKAGITKTVAKELSGHATDSVFRRYSIPDVKMMKDAGEKLSAHHQQQRRTAKTGV